MLGQVSMKQLLEAGVHFGHQSRRWNPKMKKYIYTERNGIYIIDLKKTLRMMREAYNFVRDTIADGGFGIMVGTKKQAKDSVERWAHFCGLHYVNNRWLGGTLTNFSTIRHSINRMIELQEMVGSGEIERYSKKEQSQLLREKASLEKNLQGIRNMDGMPQFIFIIDPSKEQIAVREAKKCGVPIVAVVDTNCDPDPIDYVIPGNDDAIRSINLACEKVAEATVDGLIRRVEAGLANVDMLPEEARKMMAQQQAAELGEPSETGEPQGPATETQSRPTESSGQPVAQPEPAEPLAQQPPRSESESTNE